MEVKFTVAGPPIGGAKSGINFDPNDPRKSGVLQRWYNAVRPLLKTYYGTGGDLNVDEIHEVIPMTENVGIWHPQEGIFNGHFCPTEAQKIHRVGQLRAGVVKVLEDELFSPEVSRKFTVADMITGYGVASAVFHYYNIWGGTYAGKRAIIQGWGNVASAAAFYLAQQGVKIVGIIDRAGGLLRPEGFSFAEIKDLFLQKDGNKLVHQNLISFEEVNAKVWDLKAEIFAPCAASRLVTREQVERMIKSGLEVISCGANVPFADPEIFFGATGDFTDEHIALLPDFIANCGMARVFAYLMSNDLEKLSDADIFGDTAKIIGEALKKTYSESKSKTGIAKKSFEIALRQLI
jgi:glutamate dehydrogenase/leucine dehydrogenase